MLTRVLVLAVALQATCTWPIVTVECIQDRVDFYTYDEPAPWQRSLAAGRSARDLFALTYAPSTFDLYGQQPLVGFGGHVIPPWTYGYPASIHATPLASYAVGPNAQPFSPTPAGYNIANDDVYGKFITSIATKTPAQKTRPMDDVAPTSGQNLLPRPNQSPFGSWSQDRPYSSFYQTTLPIASDGRDRYNNPGMANEPLQQSMPVNKPSHEAAHVQQQNVKNGWKIVPATTTTAAAPENPVIASDEMQNFGNKYDDKKHAEVTEQANPVIANQQQCPRRNSVDMLEYCFYNQPETMPRALAQCKRDGMQLARMTSANSEFLNRIVDEAFPPNATCIEKLTMLGNFDAAMKFGSYAYTLGERCQNNSNSSSDTAPLDVCLRYQDCTIVDWLASRPYFCVRIDTSNETRIQQQQFIELRQFYTVGDWDYYVSVDTVNQQLEGAKTDAVQPSTSTAPPFVALDPLCIPAKSQDLPKQVFEALKNDTRMPRKFAVLTQSYNQAGFARKCSPNCKDQDAQKKLFVLCAKDSTLSLEKQPANAAELTHRAQLWTNGMILYNISEEFNTTKRALIIDAMNAIAHASCIQFAPLQQSDIGASAAFISFEPVGSPNTCQSLEYGRRVGGGAHVIVLANECFAAIGHLLRQILHTLGVPPEHIRYDRDRFIRIMNDNIEQKPGVQQYFQKQLLPSAISQRIPYDFASVTHWTPEAYARQVGLHTIQSLNMGSSVKFGQRQRLSQRDVAKLDVLYGTNCTNTVVQLGNRA